MINNSNLKDKDQKKERKDERKKEQKEKEKGLGGETIKLREKIFCRREKKKLFLRLERKNKNITHKIKLEQLLQKEIF